MWALSLLMLSDLPLQIPEVVTRCLCSNIRGFLFETLVWSPLEPFSCIQNNLCQGISQIYSSEEQGKNPCCCNWDQSIEFY